MDDDISGKTEYFKSFRGYIYKCLFLLDDGAKSEYETIARGLYFISFTTSFSAITFEAT